MYGGNGENSRCERENSSRNKAIGTRGTAKEWELLTGVRGRKSEERGRENTRIKREISEEHVRKSGRGRGRKCRGRKRGRKSGRSKRKGIRVNLNTGKKNKEREN